MIGFTINSFVMTSHSSRFSTAFGIRARNKDVGEALGRRGDECIIFLFLGCSGAAVRRSSGLDQGSPITRFHHEEEHSRVVVASNRTPTQKAVMLPK